MALTQHNNVTQLDWIPSEEHKQFSCLCQLIKTDFCYFKLRFESCCFFCHTQFHHNLPKRLLVGSNIKIVKGFYWRLENADYSNCSSFCETIANVIILWDYRKCSSFCETIAMVLCSVTYQHEWTCNRSSFGYYLLNENRRKGHQKNCETYINIGYTMILFTIFYKLRFAFLTWWLQSNSF